MHIAEIPTKPVYTRPSFPTVVDASMIRTLRDCPQRFMLQDIEHWKPRGISVHLHAGAAFARGLEVVRRLYFESGMTFDQALAGGISALITAYGDYLPPEGAAKTLDRMMGALEFYFSPSGWPIDLAPPHRMPSGHYGIEFSFAEPLPIAHPETGDPIIYAGRSDMVCDFAEGVYLEDDKTASALGESWTKQWELRSQFTGYCWAARQIHIPVAGVLVRGVSILKTKYGRADAITYRSQWEIDRWLSQVVRDLQRAINCWREGYWDFALDEACTSYGGCPFVRICKAQNPAEWLPVDFERRRWDPLERTETVLGDQP